MGHDQRGGSMDEEETPVTGLSDPMPAGERRFCAGRLLIEPPNGPMFTFTLESRSEILIGRGEHSQLCLGDSKVSRAHARIAVRGDRCWITDLRSSNGTHVNDVRLAIDAPRMLAFGDAIAVGDHRLTLMRVEVASAALGIEATRAADAPLERSARGARLARSFMPRPTLARAAREFVALLDGSPLERRLAELLLRGNGRKEAAAMLGISKHAADNHCRRLCEKNRRSRWEMLAHDFLSYLTSNEDRDRAGPLDRDPRGR